MSFLNQITVLILTYNEAPNIARILSRLTWANRILIVDSGSTDDTLEIVRQYPKAEILHRPFDDHATQWNFGLSKIATEWVLSLDADYELSDDLIKEISELALRDGTSGFRARFVYRIYGRPLRAALYPPRVVLYRKNHAKYLNEGHTQRLAIEGSVEALSGKIFHDDRKPLSRWLASQQKYAQLEADHLLTRSRSELGRVDRVRLMAWPAPPLVFLYTLFAKGCILDGWPGWLYVLQRTLAETMIALELVDQRVRSSSPWCQSPESAENSGKDHLQ